MHRHPLVNFAAFLLATRDSGYRSTASALAELVDNAIQAQATQIEIAFHRKEISGQESYEISISDNGRGMNEEELNRALQFGGSSRLNSRTGLGRYGMGLPNSSLSQSRRVEVTTWEKKDACFYTYLDMDEAVDNQWTELPPVKAVPTPPQECFADSGTLVWWKKCDRLNVRHLSTSLKQLRLDLGRIFRNALWQGTIILVNGKNVVPFDPLFLHDGMNPVGGECYGEELIYPVCVPGEKDHVSSVRVQFVELPVLLWGRWSNEEKRRQCISKCAGVSVLRAGREIDYGWFFMGDKRKENYDDWWRCQISFSPDLDEVFGVTHTKQLIRETAFMRQILVPELEQTARVLNTRVRVKFSELKSGTTHVYAKPLMQRNDVYLPALRSGAGKTGNGQESDLQFGLQYEIITRALSGERFYEMSKDKSKVVLIVNSAHLFYHRVFRQLHEGKIYTPTEFIRMLELLIFAAGRAELGTMAKEEKHAIDKFKKKWSNILKTLIS